MPIIMVSSKNKVSMQSNRRKKKVIQKKILFKSSSINYVATKVVETVIVVVAVTVWNSWGKGSADKPNLQDQVIKFDLNKIRVVVI